MGFYSDYSHFEKQLFKNNYVNNNPYNNYQLSMGEQLAMNGVNSIFSFITQWGGSVGSSDKKDKEDDLNKQINDIYKKYGVEDSSQLSTKITEQNNKISNDALAINGLYTDLAQLKSELSTLENAAEQDESAINAKKKEIAEKQEEIKKKEKEVADGKKKLSELQKAYEALFELEEAKMKLEMQKKENNSDYEYAEGYKNYDIKQELVDFSAAKDLLNKYFKDREHFTKEDAQKLLDMLDGGSQGDKIDNITVKNAIEKIKPDLEKITNKAK